jgi:hypothetical protein
LKKQKSWGKDWVRRSGILEGSLVGLSKKKRKILLSLTSEQRSASGAGEQHEGRYARRGALPTGQ